MYVHGPTCILGSRSNVCDIHMYIGISGIDSLFNELPRKSNAVDEVFTWNTGDLLSIVSAWTKKRRKASKCVILRKLKTE